MGVGVGAGGWDDTVGRETGGGDVGRGVGAGTTVGAAACAAVGVVEAVTVAVDDGVG